MDGIGLVLLRLGGDCIIVGVGVLVVLRFIRRFGGRLAAAARAGHRAPRGNDAGYERALRQQREREERKARMRKIPVVGAGIALAYRAWMWARDNPAAAGLIAAGAALMAISPAAPEQQQPSPPTALPPVTRTVTPPPSTVTVTPTATATPSPTRPVPPGTATVSPSRPGNRTGTGRVVPTEEDVATIEEDQPQHGRNTYPVPPPSKRPSDGGEQSMPPGQSSPPPSHPRHGCMLPVHVDPIARVGLLCH